MTLHTPCYNGDEDGI